MRRSALEQGNTSVMDGKQEVYGETRDTSSKRAQDGKRISAPTHGAAAWLFTSLHLHKIRDS